LRVTESHAVTAVEDAIRAALGGHSRVLLAVSGGLDSTVLLDAAARVLARDSIVVATFDHGTGIESTRAADLVATRAKRIGVEFASGRASSALSGEAALRDARWRFLRAIAAEQSAVIATAHTADDQLETVVMRVMRGTGARGLASLYAMSGILRPFIGITREQLALYGQSAKLTWVEDPSNALPTYFRNRVRHDLLPALRRARPSLAAELMDASRGAAVLRAEVEQFVSDVIQPRAVAHRAELDVAADVLSAYDGASLALLWPDIVARIGLVLDRRGLARLVQFTQSGRTGRRMQLSGGWDVVRSRDLFEVRLSGRVDTTMTALSLSNTTTCGRWVFRQADQPAGGEWTAWLPTDEPLEVRAWQAGDTMAAGRSGTPKKVKRLLSNAHLTGHKRASWPVVLSGGHVVWIPGVGRSRAASDRSGRSGLPFVCEYVNT
jgi:tRNA(Ile)-lysidine synthase